MHDGKSLVSSLSEINSLIVKGEDSSTEFKASTGENMARTIVAFANGYGGIPKGYLLIGVDASQDIVGVNEDPDIVQQKIANMCRSRCEPPVAPKIRTERIGRKQIVVVEIPRSNVRPHRADGVCYIRVGSTTRQATVAEEQQIREQTWLRPFDDHAVEGATFQELDFDRVRQYYKVTRSREVVDAEQRDPKFLAEQLGLGVSDGSVTRPTVAAILTFGLNPQDHFKLSSINAARFRGSSQADPISDRREIKGTLDRMIEETWDFVRTKSSVSGLVVESSVKRMETREYPLRAVREAVANALMHRNYADPGAQIDVYMFDDRIEIRSPGGLAGGLTREDLVNRTGKRYLRNPNIAKLLHELKLVEAAGTGVLRIFMDMEDNGSPPPDYIIDHNSVKIILPAHPDYAAQRKFEEGTLAKDRGETERARNLFNEALKLRPNFSEATAALASLEGEVGPILKARQLYRDALKQNPSNVPSILNWATMEDKQGNYLEARKLYQQATELAPNNFLAWHSWALLERRLGNFPRARELFERTTQLEPENAVSWQALGQLESRARNHQAAIKYLQTALRYATDDYSKAWIHADLAFAKGNLRFPKSEVEEHYKMSLSLNPNSAQANHFYAEFLKRQDRQYEAEEHERKARLLGYQEKTPRRWRG